MATYPGTNRSTSESKILRGLFADQLPLSTVNAFTRSRVLTVRRTGVRYRRPDMERRAPLPGDYSARRTLIGSIRTAWITAGSAASKATARIASEGIASTSRSVALT